VQPRKPVQGEKVAYEITVTNLVFVIDVTGSMQEEINGVIKDQNDWNTLPAAD